MTTTSLLRRTNSVLGTVAATAALVLIPLAVTSAPATAVTAHGNQTCPAVPPQSYCVGHHDNSDSTQPPTTELPAIGYQPTRYPHAHYYDDYSNEYTGSAHSPDSHSHDTSSSSHGSAGTHETTDHGTAHHE